MNFSFCARSRALITEFIAFVLFGLGGELVKLFESIHPSGGFSLIDNIDKDEKMRLNASGFLGIGITNPSHKLSINENSSGANYINFTNTDSKFTEDL